MAQVAQWRREGLRTDQRWLRSIIERCMLVACIITVLALFFASSLLPVLAQPQSGRAFWSHLGATWNDLINKHLSWQDIKVLSPLDQSSGGLF